MNSYAGQRMKRKLGMIVLSVTLAAGMLCGCGREKEEDPAKSSVMKITITPQPSPTPKPSEIMPEAVVTEGNLTMVNEYLINEE